MRSRSIKRCEREFTRGFTLLELLVVLAIGSLLAAVAVPSAARAISGSSPVRSLRDVQTELAVARAQALRQAHEIEITLSITAGTIELRSPDRTRSIAASWIAVSSEPTEPLRVRFDSAGLSSIDALEFHEKREGLAIIWTLPFDPISGAIGRAAREKHTP